MTFNVLNAEMIGRHAQRKLLGNTLVARRQSETSIVIFKKFRGQEVAVASLTSDDRITFSLGDRIRIPAFQQAVDRIMPPDTYTLYGRPRHSPFWAKACGAWREFPSLVMVPYSDGDAFDTHARYLHARNRNNF